MLAVHLVESGFWRRSSGLMDASLRCAASYSLSRPHWVPSTTRTIATTAAAAAATAQDSEALRTYLRLRDEGARPSIDVVVGALKVCGSSRDLQTGGRIYLDVLENGDFRDVSVGNTLIDMYARCGSMGEAKTVFERMQNRDLASWDGLIMGYVQNGEHKMALEAFDRMQEVGCYPSPETLVAAMRACGGLGEKEQGSLVEDKVVKTESLQRAKDLHSQASKAGLEQDIGLVNALVEMYSKCGSMDDARAVFETIDNPDVVSWNNIVLGYAQNGQGDVALKIYEAMKAKEDLVHNPATGLAALRAVCDLAEKERGRLMERKMVKYESLKKGKLVHADLTKFGLEQNLYVANTLIEMYARCGNMVEARAIFDKMAQRDVVSWNYILTGYVQNGDPEPAVQLYQRMRAEGACTPNLMTFIAGLRACVNPSSLEAGRRIHEDVRRAGCQTHPAVVNVLVECYSRCGSVAEAQQVFDSVPQPRLPAWNALLAGYNHKGDSNCVLQLFDRMLREGLQPDADTFLSVLGACSQGLLVEQGKKLFQAMQEEHKIVPRSPHYILMVELLGRANLLDEALSFLRGLKVKVEIKMWMALLTACRQWKNATVGRQVFESILKLDDKHQGAYALMSEIFSSVGMKEESDSLETMRRAWRRNSRNDKKHPQSEQITDKLVELASRMPPDSKFFSMEEDPACGHSERLALGCALINTQPGTLVRIVKNLRVCDDCHEFFKLVSKLEERTLVCRDANRFHNFQDGKCSCNDFW